MNLILKRLLSYLPSKLPVGVSEFQTWSDSVIELSGEFADRDSMKFALASQVIHLGPQKSSVPKNFFVRSMRKAAANQVASQVFQDIKLKQQLAAEKAALAAKQAEDTANKEAESPDVQF